MLDFIDQGCQTDGDRARFFVTALGELFRDGQPLGCSPADLDPLSAEERAFDRKVCALQEAAEDGRFRVYGEIRQGGVECIVLVTEFRDFCDDASFWSVLAEMAAELQAHVWFMEDEVPHLDQFKHTEDEDWQYGPRHGDPQRQVELSWRIEQLSVPEMLALQERIKKVTEPAWQQHGVAVC